MEKLLVGIAAVAFCGAPALAADAPVAYKAPPTAVAPIFNWSGLYLGIVGGGGWGTSNQFVPGPAPESSGPFHIPGGLIGSTLGYNWQNGPVVLGVEGDFSWANIRGSTMSAHLSKADSRPCAEHVRFVPNSVAGYSEPEYDLRRCLSH